MSKVVNLLWTLLTHLGPHLDEALAIWLLWKYGEKLYPGISQAKVEFVQARDYDPNEDWMSAHYVPIGVLHSVFDHHARPGEDLPDWKVGHCSATLVADILGIYGDPAWERLLEITRQNDLDGVGNEWDLAFLTKNIGGDQEALDFAHWAIDALHHHEVMFIENGMGFNPEDAAQFFDCILAAWLRSEFGCKTRWSLKKMADYVLGGTKKLSAAKLAEKLEESKKLTAEQKMAIHRIVRYSASRPRDANMWELRGIPWLIWLQHQDRPEIAIQWALDAIRCKFKAQQEFLGPTAKEYKKAKIRWIRGPRGKRLQMATIVSDRPLIAKYCRWRGAAIVIQQDPESGNVWVFTSANDRLDISKAVERIRAAEVEAAGGDEEAAGRWHYQNGPLSESLLNGSKRNGVWKIRQPATVLSLRKIRNLVVRGLKHKTGSRSKRPARK